MSRKEIRVVPYDPSWPEQFQQEAEQIKLALGENFIAIHHVGSTAVPDLVAKPKIDMIAVVKNPQSAIKSLENIGYDYRGEFNIPMHFGFSKRAELSVNLHVYEENNPEIELNLLFRDYLRNHPEIREEYAKLKMELVEEKRLHEKHGPLFSGYNLGKNALITRVLKLTGFDRLRFVRCTHYDEWEAAKELRNRYFFDKIKISDPYEWTFEHQDHVHFVLYKGTEIIGYAHIQLWPHSRAAIRIIVIEQEHQHHGFGKQFLSWIETWLKSQRYQSLHTQASPDALRFYQQLGYSRMPFDDPDGHETDPRDTPMGKQL